MSGGAKILEGLRHAAEGNMTRVRINGQNWVRHDAESPEGRLNQARAKIADLTQEIDILKSAMFNARTKLGAISMGTEGALRASVCTAQNYLSKALRKPQSSHGEKAE